MITVNGEPIDETLVEECFNRIKSDAENRLKVSCCERNDEFTAQAEDEVIDSVLIAQDVDQYDQPPSDADITSRMEAMIKEYREHGASWDMLEKQRDAMREKIVADLRMHSYIEDLLASAPELTEEDIKKYYENSKKSFTKPKRVHCLHIGLFPQNHHDVNALLDHAAEIREKGLSADDFKAFAIEHTEKEDKDIDLGWIDIEDPLHPFEALVFTMLEGELSPVLSYDQAYHLIKVVEIQPSTIPPLDEIREQVIEMAQYDRRKEAIAARSAALREKATILRADEPSA